MDRLGWCIIFRFSGADFRFLCLPPLGVETLDHSTFNCSLRQGDRLEQMVALAGGHYRGTVPDFGLPCLDLGDRLPCGQDMVVRLDHLRDVQL
jgi:hypothetical protein